MTDQELADWKICKKHICEELVKFGIISAKYTGHIILNFNGGSISDISHKIEKSLLKKQLYEIRTLRTAQNHVIINRDDVI